MIDFRRRFEPSVNLLSEPDQSMMNTLTLSRGIITILSSVKKVSLPREDDYGRLAVVFVISALFGCTQPASGPAQEPLALPLPLNYENVHDRGGGGGM